MRVIHHGASDMSPPTTSTPAAANRSAKRAPRACGEPTNSASTTIAETTTTTTPRNRHELVHFSAVLRDFLRHRSPPTDPSFDAIVISFRCVSSGSHMFVFSSHTCPAHSETSTAALTTPALDRRSLRWFGISAPTATPQDPPPSLAQYGSCRRSSTSSSLPFRTHVGAHNAVVGADHGFRAPSWDQESVRDSVHEDSASALNRGRSTTTAEFPAPTRLTSHDRVSGTHRTASRSR